MPRCATCGAIIIKTRLTDQRDGFKQSDVDFQIKRARFPTTTQKSHCFIFRESVFPLFSSRWRSKNFNKIFSSLLLCSRGVFFRRLWVYWPGVRLGKQARMLCGERRKMKKLIPNKAVGFISRAIFFSRLFVLFPFMLTKPIIKIKQKTCLFSPNINTNERFFSPHECILNKTLNSPSQQSLFFSPSRFFHFIPVQSICQTKRRAPRGKSTRFGNKCLIIATLHSFVSIKLFHSATQTHQKHINFYPRLAEALYLLLCVQRHYFYDISGCGWKWKRVKKVKTVWE